ncbi:MAG TPA: YggS family pyridoxal phosphate-dependent enzyme [Firmicutes bacterium]|nr:YggS family pyridoxal phosphate-dependent enzyme [Bacillota bacterium]
MAVAENLARIKREIRLAAEKAGRDPGEITVVAVSKGATLADIKAAYSLGLRDFGENRLQDARQKISALPGDIRWHFIGHLQSNKVKEVIRSFVQIQSLDRLSLAGKINKAALEAGATCPCLVQVNIAAEKSKFGLRPEEVKDFLAAVSVLKGIKIRGFMAMAPLCRDPEETRPYFKAMRRLYEDNKNFPGTDMTFLSMGMSNDFHIAVEEGANMVRIGSKLFSN